MIWPYYRSMHTTSALLILHVCCAKLKWASTDVNWGLKKINNQVQCNFFKSHSPPSATWTRLEKFPKAHGPCFSWTVCSASSPPSCRSIHLRHFLCPHRTASVLPLWLLGPASTAPFSFSWSRRGWRWHCWAWRRREAWWSFWWGRWWRGQKRNWFHVFHRIWGDAPDSA